MPTRLGSILLLLFFSTSGLNADRPYSTTRPPKTAFSSPDSQKETTASTDTSKGTQWRKKSRVRPGGPLFTSPETGAATENKSKFVPGKAANAPRADTVQGTSAQKENPEAQWRINPGDRRWETWRELPPSQQIDLWRDLTLEEKNRYWDAMNVHERATLWTKMDPEEKERCWDRLPETDRRALCDNMPPKERALWSPRLAANTGSVGEDKGAAKFKPAKPLPGYQPKSNYTEEDE